MHEADAPDVLLEDPGDFDEAREPEPETPNEPATPDEPPTHRVVCMAEGCGAAVTYRPTILGGGFFVLERVGMDLEASLGIGLNGRPICPVEGHGEMTLADEQLPAVEAFAQVAEKLDAPVQGDLPGVFPAFNYQGCYLELEEKAAEVNALHEEYLEAKEAATDAKKAWDKAAELYTKMALEFRRRRQAKGDLGPTQADPPARALVCVWDKAHPDEACPLCQGMTKPESIEDWNEIANFFGEEILPKDAQGHIDQALRYKTMLDIHATLSALDEVVYGITESVVYGWSPEDRREVRDWADAGANRAEIPTVLGCPHVAAEVDDGAKVQACATCGGVLKQLDADDETYPAAALVRTDCAGPEQDGHRYPERTKKQPRARAKTDSKAKGGKKRGKGRG
jgi:hypothetical protein